MNKTIQPSAHQLLATVPTGLTSVPYPEEDKPMTDEEVTKAIEAANSLFSLSDPLTGMLIGEAILQDENAYYYFLGVFSERVRMTLTLIRDPKATALLNELRYLTRRLLRPYDRVSQEPWGLWLACGTLVNYLRGKLGVPSSGLSQSELMKQCKWSRASCEEDIETIIDKVTQYLATLYKPKRQEPHRRPSPQRQS